MRFVDTHLHLDSDAFDGDRESVLAASREAGVTRWINVGYNEERWQSTRVLTEQIDGMSSMVGLHPVEADAWSDALLKRLRATVGSVKPVAIGEIGMDLYWRQDNLAIQRQAFSRQLELARELALPAVIHMRSADTEVLDVLHATEALPHIHFHSFDGNEALRLWTLRNGATVGVGGLVTRRGSEDLLRWVSSLPRDRIVLETDAPYLKPRGIRGKRNEPAYMVKVAKLLAEMWGVDVESVAATTTRNAERIFALKEESE